jgi:hypothetical protein
MDYADPTYRDMDDGTRTRLLQGQTVPGSGKEWKKEVHYAFVSFREKGGYLVVLDCDRHRRADVRNRC